MAAKRRRRGTAERACRWGSRGVRADHGESIPRVRGLEQRVDLLLHIGELQVRVVELLLHPVFRFPNRVSLGVVLVLLERSFDFFREELRLFR